MAPHAEKSSFTNPNKFKGVKIGTKNRALAYLNVGHSGWSFYMGFKWTYAIQILPLSSLAIQKMTILKILFLTVIIDTIRLELISHL